MLGLVIAVFLGFKYRGLKTMFYSLKFETLSFWRVRALNLLPLGTG
jgi:hypothetical protein